MLLFLKKCHLLWFSFSFLQLVSRLVENKHSESTFEVSYYTVEIPIKESAVKCGRTVWASGIVLSRHHPGNTGNFEAPCFLITGVTYYTYYFPWFKPNAAKINTGYQCQSRLKLCSWFSSLAHQPWTVCASPALWADTSLTSNTLLWVLVAVYWTQIVMPSGSMVDGWMRGAERDCSNTHSTMMWPYSPLDSPFNTPKH